MNTAIARLLRSYPPSQTSDHVEPLTARRAELWLTGLLDQCRAAQHTAERRGNYDTAHALARFIQLTEASVRTGVAWHQADPEAADRFLAEWLGKER